MSVRQPPRGSFVFFFGSSVQKMPAKSVALLGVFLALGLSPGAEAFGLGIGNTLDMIRISKEVVMGVAKLWNFIDEYADFPDVPMPIFDRKERKLFSKMNLINTKLDRLGEQLGVAGSQTISAVLQSLPDRVRLELRLNDLLKYLTILNANYRNMEDYIKDKDAFERLTLEDFAQFVVSHDTFSVRNLAERIHSFVVPQGKGLATTGLLRLLEKSFEKMPHDVTYGLESLESVWVWARAYAELRGIYALYESFKRFQGQQTAEGRIPSPRQAWIDLTEAILNDPKDSVVEATDRLEALIKKEGLFEEALKEVEGDMACNSQQSPQQVLYNLYNEIALSELKGYSMVQFSYMLLKLYDKGNFTREAQIMRDRFEARTNDMIETIKKTMEKASRQLWMCDPKKHEKGRTYEEITQLLQGYVQNEVDLNPDGNCWENCAAYTYTKSHSCYQNLYCRQQRRCNGKIINCKFYDSDMWICPADPKTNRRYEYIEYENGRVLGRKQGCQKGTLKVDSWWRWLVWHCSYCMCLCDEQGAYSDRYFNMRAAVANTKDNHVVTGLRFVKKNRIIHLQIQEGRLEPHGKIDLKSVQWVPVEDYKINDRHIKNGQDYHTLTWENRAIDLDDLYADEGHVVTGVRFKEIGSHLNFEIMIAPFDFATGRLIEPNNRSFWKDNLNTASSLKNPRTRVRVDNSDVPTRSPLPSIPDSKHDEYVEFTNTDFDRDAAQTTVPFLDAQPVTSLIPVPLGGAGVYHKGRKNFGGFVAPKIITYDYSKHLQPAFPPESEPEVN